MTRVHFKFAFITDDPDRLEVLVRPLKLKEIEQDCDRIIASGRDEITCSDGDHTTSCPQHDAYDIPWADCIGDKLAEARRIKDRLPLLYLLRECALNQAKANRAGTETLSGMALARGPIMQNRQVSDADLPITDKIH